MEKKLRKNTPKRFSNRHRNCGRKKNPVKILRIHRSWVVEDEEEEEEEEEEGERKHQKEKKSSGNNLLSLG
jgi:hypothetical protein